MNKTMKDFLSILKDTILGIESDYDYSETDWEALYNFAIKTKIPAVINDSIQKLSGQYNIDQNILEAWNNEIIEVKKHTATSNEQLSKVIISASEANIPITLIKGCVLANCYPNSELRPSGDADILVNIENAQPLSDLLFELGYNLNYKCSSENVATYFHQETLHKIEMHFCLWERLSGPRINILKSLGLHNKTTTLNLLGTEITTLNHKQHLIYQIFHLIKHFMLEGISLRNFTDITLFVNKYISEINIESFWSNIDSLGYGVFTDGLFQFCIEYLGMNNSIINNRTAPSTEAVEAIIDEINIKTATDAYAGYNMKTLYSFFKPYAEGKLLETEDKYQEKLNLDTYADMKDCIVSRMAHLDTLGLICHTSLPNAIDTPKYFYKVYGLILESELEMTELTLANEEEKLHPDVYIHEAIYLPLLPDGKAITISDDDQEIKFRTEYAVYHVINSKEIVFRVLEKGFSEPYFVKSFILSHALSFALYQRNIITFHSSTVGSKDGAVTIIGRCGAGKSTTSIELRQRGHKLVADDISAIYTEGDVCYVEPAIPQQKLCRDTALKLGYSLDEIECINADRDKYRVILKDDEMCLERAKLKAIYYIEKDYSSDQFHTYLMPTQDAILTLGYNTFSIAATANDGMTPSVFKNLINIIKNVPVYMISRPAEGDTLDKIIAFIEETSNLS